MNERIRELAEQAGINCVVPTIGTLEYSGKGEVEHLKKFAELIVREAMTVTKNYTCNQGLDYSAPVALARHFGVRS